MSSYLFLFISFYLATYKKTGKQSTKIHTERAAKTMEKKQLPTVQEASQTAKIAVKSIKGEKGYDYGVPPQFMI